MLRLRAHSMPIILMAATCSAAAGLGVAVTATPSIAASKGNCTPFASVSAGGRNEWKLSWAGSSSGWSPAGKLTIKVTPVINGVTGGTASGSKSDSTSITIGPISETILASSATLKVTVHATGPAGSVTCSKTV